MPGSIDTFVKGASRIVVTNNRANVLSSAEVTLPDGKVIEIAKGKLKWERTASWLIGDPKDKPAPVYFDDSQRLAVSNWAGGEHLAGGDVYRAGLKMIAELQGGTVTSARLAGD